MWFATLEKLKLDAVKMPRDVRTRWNSTYDMLEFAVRHRMAIDDIAGNKAANLRRYELCDEEWKIAEQLCEMLKVRVSHFSETNRNKQKLMFATCRFSKT